MPITSWLSFFPSALEWEVGGGPAFATFISGLVFSFLAGAVVGRAELLTVEPLPLARNTRILLIVADVRRVKSP